MIETKQLNGQTVVKTNCSVCKQCWIFLSGPYKGKCIYDGPYLGYVKENGETKEITKE